MKGMLSQNRAEEGEKKVKKGKFEVRLKREQEICCRYPDRNVVRMVPRTRQ